MEELLEIVKGTKFASNLRCVEAVLRDYKIKTLEDLENLPAKRSGRTVVCGFDIFEFVNEIKTIASSLDQIPSIEEALFELELEEEE